MSRLNPRSQRDQNLGATLDKEIERTVVLSLGSTDNKESPSWTEEVSRKFQKST